MNHTGIELCWPPKHATYCPFSHTGYPTIWSIPNHAGQSAMAPPCAVSFDHAGRPSKLAPRHVATEACYHRGMLPPKHAATQTSCHSAIPPVHHTFIEPYSHSATPLSRLLMEAGHSTTKDCIANYTCCQHLITPPHKYTIGIYVSSQSTPFP